MPAGSVAVAGLQTAVYPTASAGGWNLIGRTGAVLFDPLRDPPALLAPDDRVRFVPSADALARDGEPADRAVLGAAIVEVVDGGWLTTVQDRGRAGFRRFGVSSAGALDHAAADAANAAVGNAGDAALLECTSAGPVLRFLAAARFAIAGADLEATLERADLGEWRVPPATSVFARTGNVLRFGARARGFRAYVALGGGVDVPRRLGSRATDLPGAFGGYEGRPLRAGDRLSLGWLAGVPGTDAAAGRGRRRARARRARPAGRPLRAGDDRALPRGRMGGRPRLRSRGLPPDGADARARGRAARSRPRAWSRAASRCRRTGGRS